MNIKVRIIILFFTMYIIIRQLMNAVLHRGVNIFLTILAACGLIYLVLTAEEHRIKRNKKRSRKILHDDGEYKEHPDFRKKYYDIVGDNIKKYRKIKSDIYREYAFVLIYILLILATAEEALLTRMIVIFVSVTSCLMYFVSNRRGKSYRIRKEFVNNFYDDFIKRINSNFVFSRGDKNKQETVLDLKSCFNRDSIFDYSIYGIVNGYVNDGIPIKIVDIKEATFADFKVDNHSASKFRGIVTISNSIVNVNGKLKITKNRESIPEKDKKIKVLLDNTEFENIYNVFSPDKIFAMRILTPEIMELLVEFDKYAIEFDLIIVDNKIIIRFYEDNMFDFSFARHTFNREDLFLTYCITNFSINLINTINKSLKGYIG